MTITVRPLRNTFFQRRQFINLPWKIYRDNPYWVPPLKQDMHTLLNPDKHPFHQHAETQLFVAEQSGQVVGRIAAFVNQAHNEYWEDKVGFFGFFESVEDQRVADALFEAARDFLQSKGSSHIRGPFNWSTNEECGLLVDTFDRPPVVMMPYNHPYYITLLENAGLEKIKDLYAYHIENASSVPDRLKRGVEIMKKRHDFNVRSVDMDNFWQEVALIKRMYNEAWGRNWGAVPMTDEEIHHLAKDLRLIVDPNICYIAELNDEPIGFSLTLPDINQALIHLNGRLLPSGFLKLLWHKRKIDYVRVLLLGVLEDHRHQGVDVAMYYRTFHDGLNRGYHSGEFSWILEDNYPMRHALEKFGAEIYKTYRIYQQSL